MTSRSTTFLVASLLGILLLTLAPQALAQTDPHAGHEQTTPDAGAPPEPRRDLPPFIPPVTDEDRRAAFPVLESHAVHDEGVNYFVLLDQLEWQAGDGVGVMNLDSGGWLGRDSDRLWFRAEGHGSSGGVEALQAHVLYGRQISRWWDLVAGVRQDFEPGSAQTFAAVGLQGLAPYWFEIGATAYVGASGRPHARFEVEYDLLVTNRLILQPRFEAELVGKSDPGRGAGSGLSTTELGFRLRYEVRREAAPYVGVTWGRKWGQTADFAEAAGHNRGGGRIVTGMRIWF